MLKIAADRAADRLYPGPKSLSVRRSRTLQLELQGNSMTYLELDRWQERSAIMEYDGGMSRDQAEILAASQLGHSRREFVEAAARVAKMPDR